MKFWKWLYLHARKQYRKAHCKKVGVDIKCPKCQEWFSVSGIRYKHTQKSSDGLHQCTCGQCKTTSFWSSNIAPVPVRTTSKGVPV